MDPAALFLRGRKARETRAVARILGLASLGIGMLGMLAPGWLSRLMRIDRSAVWLLSVRDLVSAWLLLSQGGRFALLSRAVFDAGDAVMMVRRRPLLALPGAASAVVGAAAALGRFRPRRR